MLYSFLPLLWLLYIVILFLLLHFVFISSCINFLQFQRQPDRPFAIFLISRFHNALPTLCMPPAFTHSFRMVTSATRFLPYFSLHSFKFDLPSQPSVFRFLITDEVTSFFLITFHFILCFTPSSDAIFLNNLNILISLLFSSYWSHSTFYRP